MTHKRNTDGLIKAAKQRRADTIKRVDQAIKQLLKENKQINFNSVSKISGVGKPWLYKESTICQHIEKLREQTKIKSKSENKADHGASDKSKDQIIQMLKSRITKLEAENNEFKTQIEILYGEIYIRKGIAK